MGRVLSSIGVGSATVDTVLPRPALRPGETATATVELSGGDATQSIEGIYFSLTARVEDERGGAKRVLAEPAIDRSITLEPGEEQSIPVELDVPLWTPLSRGDVVVRLATGLDIPWARDPSDEEAVTVEPGEIAAALFAAVEALGFARSSTAIVDAPVLDDRPFAQVFSFRPTDDAMAELVEGLELTLIPREEDLRVFLEVDQRDPVADAYDLDLNEQETSITFDRADPGLLRRRLRTEIERYA